MKDLTFDNADGGTLDGKGAVIHGSVIVNCDNYTVNNLTVIDDFTLTDQVTTSFESNKLTVEGTTQIAGEDQQQAFVAAAYTLSAESNPKTRIRITFNDSTIAVIQIAKKDVHFTATGSTEVTELSLFANAEIFANEGIIIPKISIFQGVTQVELNASIKDVVIDSNDDMNVTGKGNFENVTVSTEKTVSLGTTGTIMNLDMGKEMSKFSIGETAVIGNIILPEGKEVEDIVENFEQAKEQIDKIAGKKNPEFNEELRDKFGEIHFAAGLMEVRERFGYVKLNVMNQGDHRVKYLLYDRSEDYSTLPEVGDKAPSAAIDYKKDEEFILWIDLWFIKLMKRMKSLNFLKWMKRGLEDPMLIWIRKTR